MKSYLFHLSENLQNDIFYLSELTKALNFLMIRSLRRHFTKETQVLNLIKWLRIFKIAKAFGTASIRWVFLKIFGYLMRGKYIPLLLVFSIKNPCQFTAHFSGISKENSKQIPEVIHQTFRMRYVSNFGSPYSKYILHVYAVACVVLKEMTAWFYHKLIFGWILNN